MQTHSINVDFLRSGRQFGANDTGTGPAVETPSRYSQLERFHSATLEAAAAVTARKDPTLTINLDLLRSGRQFGAATDSTAGCAVEQPSRYSRLERFHSATLEAAAAATLDDQAETFLMRLRRDLACKDPTSTIDLEFDDETFLMRLRRGLRSGCQFGTAPHDSVAATANAREDLDVDHQAETFLMRLRRREDSTTAAHTINLNFLRSGSQFAVASPDRVASESNVTKRAAGKSPSSGSEAKRLSLHERLEQFYTQTQLAAANLFRAPNRRRQVPDAPTRTEKTSFQDSENAALPTLDTIVNLKFLQSGGEFQPPSSSSPFAQRRPLTNANRMSKFGRLEEFHLRSLHAAAAATRAQEQRARSKSANDGEPAPTLVNLKFLQSGNEFQPATSTSPTARRKVGGRGLSRHQRLEQFHAKTLLAAEGRGARSQS